MAGTVQSDRVLHHDPADLTVRVRAAAHAVEDAGEAAIGRVRLRRHPRRFVAYGVGTAKSGTTSIARLFGRAHRAAHEPESARLVPQLPPLLDDPRPPSSLVRYLRLKDPRLRLEMESSHYLGLLAGTLAELHPEARFVLTIRPPADWLDSHINQELTHRASPRTMAWRRARFDVGRPHRPEEAALAAAGCFTVEGYLRYWELHNRRVLEAVPADRLLVLPTSEISARVRDLARFVGADPDALDLGQAHAFTAPEHQARLDLVDPDYLAEQIAARCPLASELDL